MAAEHIRHWTIGEVKVARIVEVNSFEDDMALLLPNGTPEFVQQYKWLVPHFATQAGRMLISFQCFVNCDWMPERVRHDAIFCLT